MNEFNQILSYYLLGLPIITVPLSLFAIIVWFLGMTQLITNKQPKPITNKLSRFSNFISLVTFILIAASQLYIAFR